MSNTPNIDLLTEQLSALGIKPKKTRAEMNGLKRKLQMEKDKELIELQTLKDSKPHPYDWYLICDFEATCDQDSGFDYTSEVIEFPVILINSNTLQEVSRFHKYVRPKLNPILSEFCIQLTGIQQETVEAADTFDIVYRQFKDWLHDEINSTCLAECIFVTDGPWDLRDFLEKEFTYYEFKRPEYMYKIIDIRKVFEIVHEKPSGSLSDMLHYLKFEFKGREHSGIDDTYNISRIFLELAKTHRMDFTTNLRKHKARKGEWCKLRKQ